MMDEVMVSICTLPLLLQEIFFIMQNVGIPFQNYFAKSWNLARNEATKLTYNQINAARVQVGRNQKQCFLKT
jgi:hypothetical protein